MFDFGLLINRPPQQTKTKTTDSVRKKNLAAITVFVLHNSAHVQPHAYTVYCFHFPRHTIQYISLTRNTSTQNIFCIFHCHSCFCCMNGSEISCSTSFNNGETYNILVAKNHMFSLSESCDRHENKAEALCYETFSSHIPL